MDTPSAITCLCIDIGGVLLTNGWDHLTRKQAASHFKLDWAEMEERHQLNFATYEEGKLSLDRYLTGSFFMSSDPSQWISSGHSCSHSHIPFPT
ncbi:hypothetical protein Q9L42_017720 [Methylomarinum sp. Ch1-1]|uniref:HAD family phosphatase n=1 Tax=Methylomarinum roseum TaxID=3067653 RepID=A0AAU7NT86_9GAMM|nr:hypothetical protein [Methylomarinum sp. Ch1-1]MDP4519823.1 hypothetical protein [Methylomarinum sp. Ch1-1]